jgi:hypothetical protein
MSTATMLAIALFAGAAGLAHPQQLAPTAPPVAGVKLDSLGWMAGHWIGTGSDVSEEVWLPPTADAMLGMWRWANAGTMRLYELLTIAREQDRIVLRLRHFRPDLVALEEKEKPFVLPLVKIAPREAVFEGIGSDGGPLTISYRRPTGNRLEASVERGGRKDGFVYRLKK